MNALFTRSSVHNNLIWKFSDNICLLPAKINHAVIVARSVEVNVGNGGIHDNLMYYSQNEEEDMCNKESITNWQNNRIQCRRRMIIEECVCSDVPMTGNEDPIKVPKTSTMMLLIGDCQQRLLLDLVSDPTTVIMPVTEQSIYLYRYFYCK
jgi:hypothetical protein